MKKWLCVLLLAALVCALPALAAADVMKIDLSKLDSSWINVSEKSVTIPAAAEYEITGTLPKDTYTVLNLPVSDGTKITLNDAQIHAYMEIGTDNIHFKNSPEEQVTLHLKGEKNSIETLNTDYPAIYCYTSLTITAEENAKLKVSNGIGGGITSKGDMVIEGGDIVINVGRYGLSADIEHRFTLNGGNVTIDAKLGGIYGEDGLQPEMNGGSLNISVPSTPPAGIIRFTAAVMVLEDGKEPHPLKLGKPANLPGFIGWNVNGTIMQPGDLVTLTLDEKFHPTFVIRDLSITPAFAFPSAPSVPKTGDSANIALWLGLLAVSAMGAIILGRKAKKA